MAQRMQEQLAPVFQRYGVALENFAVESVSLPEELQKALDTRIALGMSGDLDKFTKYQTATAIPMAAQNEGGIAGVGAGLAAGAVIGQAMSQGISQAAKPAAEGAAAAATDPVAKLQQLKRMLELNLITAQEYDAAKAEILRQLAG